MIEYINIGTTDNDGTGDTLREGGIKINAAIAELVVSASATATGTSPEVASHLQDGSIHFTSGSIIITKSQISDYTEYTLPSGVISGSSQINISESQISDLQHYTDADTLAYLNSISVVSGSVVSSYTDLTNIPVGIVSSSAQITITESQISDLQHTVIPVGTISGSSQITITESQISDLTHYTDSDVKNKLNLEGVVSGSVISSLPIGLVSGSSQVDITQTTNYATGIKSRLNVEDVISGSARLAGTTNTTAYTPSGDYNVATKKYVDDSVIAAGGYTDEQAQDAIGSTLTDSSTISLHYNDTLSLISASVIVGAISIPSSQVTDFNNAVVGALPAGTISGSSQVSITESQISDLSHYTDSDTLDYINSLAVLSGSAVVELPAGLVSGSSQIDHNQTTNYDAAKHFTQAEISITESQISDLQHTVIPSGTISGSSQITITESQISDLSHYTDADALAYINSISVVSGSVITSLPSGTVSGSSQITITESQISDLSHTDISHLNSFSSSIQTQVNAISAVTSSYLTSLPVGTVSGSSQITIGDTVGFLSGSRIVGDIQASSVEYVNVLNKPTLISGSSQITITESQISDLQHTDISHLNSFSASIQTEVDTLSAATGSYLTSLPSGVISGSSQVSITESQISDLAHYTDSDVKNKLNLENVVSGSYVSSLPNGVVSGSSQIDHNQTTNYDAAKHFTQAQISITESQISDLKTYQITSEKGQANGYASLDSGGLVPAAQLPSYVDDVLEYADLASFPGTGVTGKIYVAIDTNKTYRWSGTVYVYITSGAVDSVAGKTGVVTLVKGDVGLSNVDNTSDANKPVSTATQTALDGKVDDGQVLTNVPAGALFTDTIYTPPVGLVSGSAQVSYPALSNIPVGIVSGSSQVVSILSSLNTYTGSNDTLNTAQNSRLTQIETITGSLATTYETRGNGIVSSSAQITPLLPTGTVSGSSQISFTTITNKPTLVSGSSQVSYPALSNIPAGIVSGSSQVSFLGITNVPVGLASGSVAYKNINNNFTTGQTIIQSGSNVLTISGSQGTLFTVSDEASDTLLRVNDNIGYAQFTVDTTGSVSASRYIGDGSQLTGISATIPDTVAYKNISNNFTGSQQIYSSGSTVFTVSGSVGDLMKVDDTNTGTRVRLNNSDGSSIFTIDSVGAVSASSFVGDGSALTGIGSFTLPAGVVSGSAQILPVFVGAGADSVKIGSIAAASGQKSIAIGSGSLANQFGGIAIGNGASTTVWQGGIAIGENSINTQEDSIAIGKYSSCSGAWGTAIGAYSQATAADAIAIGDGATAQHTRAISVGYSADATGDRSSAFGGIAQATHTRSSAFGYAATTTKNYQVVLGGTDCTEVLTTGTVVASAFSGSASGLSNITVSNLDASLKSEQAIAAVDVDWSTGIQFTKTLTAATTFTFSNYTLGKTITLKLSGNYASTFPTGVDATELADYDGTKTNWIQIYCGDATTPVFLSSLRAR